VGDGWRQGQVGDGCQSAGKTRDVIGLTEPLMFIVDVSGECEFLKNSSGGRTRGYCQK
jgi:hypothetical protein